jgi:hypothetical protein
MSTRLSHRLKHRHIGHSSLEKDSSAHSFNLSSIDFSRAKPNVLGWESLE